jgi:NADH-quinone oxidoreductase subunit H
LLILFIDFILTFHEGNRSDKMVEFLLDPVGFLYIWATNLLSGWGLSPDWAHVIVTFIGIVVFIALVMVLDVFLVWIERKVVARFQDRLGPNRIGPWGIFQPFADIIKLLIKESITPVGADVAVYNLAPILSLFSVLLLWAILPIAPVVFGVDLNVALVFMVAAGAIGTLSIIMAGWSSNNKYALLGAYRMVATMISYEIPMLLTLLIPAILTGSMSVKTITEAQSGYWFVLVVPLPALIFLISAIAELGRSPFDLNEGESEIVSGFHIEYTGMKFGLFYAGELLHAFTFGGLVAVLFFGGWNGPGVAQMPILGAFYFMVKALFGYWVIMWIKYTVPRIRIDHMLAFNWKFLTPLSLVTLMVVAVMHKVFSAYGIGSLAYIFGMLLTNVVLIWITIEILHRYSRQQREVVESRRQVALEPVQSAHH